MPSSSSLTPWPIVRIRDLGRLIGGGTPSRKNQEFFRGVIPWITTQDIPEHDVAPISLARDYISEDAISESATNIVCAGCVLIDTRVTVGKTAISGTRMCFSQDVTAIQLDRPDLVDAMYVARCLRSRRASLLQKNQGSTIAGITKDTLALEQIPLPPISEQRRIVAILHEAEEVRRLRVGSNEIVQKLAEKIFYDHLRKYKPVTRYVSIGDTVQVKSGEFLPASAMKLGTVPVYGGNGINGYHNKSLFSSSKICIGRVGAYCGVVHLTMPNSWITDNALYVSEIKIPANITYLASALKAAGLNRFASQGGQPLISASRIYPVTIPLMPMPEQDKFDMKARETFDLINQHDAIEKMESITIQSLSSQAFSGKLTAIWRDRHLEQLTREAAEREAWLATQGVTNPRQPAPVDLTIKGRFVALPKGVTTDQAFILMRMRSDEPDATHYVTAQSLAKVMEGRLRHDARAIDGHLTVLADRGLIIPVSREIDEPNLGTIYGKAYRLPRRDDLRYSSEIARLAATLSAKDTGSQR